MAAPDVQGFLLSRQGEVLMTLTGKPNEIMEVTDSFVLVGTEQKPEGSRVYFSYLQSEVDRLWSESGERNIVKTGRGAVVGAVLREMGYEVLGRPRRVVVPVDEVDHYACPLDPSESTWTKDELAEALDAYAAKEGNPSSASVDRLSELLRDFPLVQELADEPEIADAPEGRILTRIHRTRERSRRLVEQKKRSVLKREGKLKCEACEFDFESSYGERGQGFIECHHTLPLSKADEGSRTRVDDLALICANCHRMIHARSPWLTLEELRGLIDVQPKIRLDHAS